MIDIVIFYILLASIFILNKEVIMYVQPFFLTSIRAIPAGICLLLYYCYFQKKRLKYSKKDIIYFMIYSITFLIVDSFRLIGLQYIPATQAAIISSISPFIAALFSYIFLNESFNFKKIAALIFGFSSIFPLLLQGIYSTSGIKWKYFIYYGAILIASICGTINGIISRKLTAHNQYSIAMILGTVMLSSGCISLLLSLLFEQWNVIPMTHFHITLPLILYIFIIHNLLLFPWFSHLVKKYSVTLVSFVQLIMPFFTALLSLYFLNEQITNNIIISFAGLCISLYVFYYEGFLKKLKRVD